MQKTLDHINGSWKKKEVSGNIQQSFKKVEIAPSSNRGLKIEKRDQVC